VAEQLSASLLALLDGAAEHVVRRVIEELRQREAIRACSGPVGNALASKTARERKERFERLVREIEWKLVEMPLPRFQTIGSSDDPFPYQIGWSRNVRRIDFTNFSFIRTECGPR